MENVFFLGFCQEPKPITDGKVELCPMALDTSSIDCTNGKMSLR